MMIAPGRSLGYGRVGDCFLYVSSRRSLLDADWNDYMAWFKRSLPPVATGVVFERSSGPNASQRKQIADVTSPIHFRVAVLAPSALVRGVVTALNWFKDGYKAFSPDDMDQALRFLALDSASASETKQVLRDLAKDLDA